MNASHARRVFRRAKAVCFDVDSTVVTEEGIDVLAAECGAGPAVAEWTRRAMGGGVPFHVALQARLDLFKPGREDVRKVLERHPMRLTDGMEDLMRRLHKDKHVRTTIRFIDRTNAPRRCSSSAEAFGR
jgi:phosphoserine phosphatase